MNILFKEMPNYQILMNNSESVFMHLINESPVMYQALKISLKGLAYFTLGTMIRIENGLDYSGKLEEFYQMCNDVEFITSKALVLCYLTGLDIDININEYDLVKMFNMEESLQWNN